MSTSLVLKNLREENKMVSSIKPDRWVYFWLAIGTLLLMLSTGRFSVALAAWLAPVFLIRFFRSQRVGRGFIFTLLFLVVAYGVAWRSILSFLIFESLPVYMVMAFFMALTGSLPFLADRCLAPRLKGFAGTLVFPLAVTALFFLYDLVSPMGSFGTVGYEQFSNQALTQLVSVTGLWGLTFLVSWFGPVINWVWERSFNWSLVHRGLMVFTAILSVVLIFGGLRLSFAHLEPGTVQVHSFSLTDEIYHRYEQDQSTKEMNDSYIQGTIREANRGAQIVLWPEMAAGGVAQEADAVLIRAQEVARQEEIYLVIGMQIAFPNESRPTDNRLIMINPSGEIVVNQLKYGATIISNNTPGDRILKTVNTPYGTLMGMICWDADFPTVVNQVGHKGADILFVPSGDNLGVARLHVQQAIFRAIENGVSLIRQDSTQGLSVATDPYGRVLAAMDTHTASERVMVVQVPTQRVFTVYSVIGDLFGWLFVAGFVAIFVLAMVGGRKSASANP
jgi:apolipoprotein N-acyltransferase